MSRFARTVRSAPFSASGAHSPWACPAWTVTPVNAAMISAVLAFADIHRDMGSGRTLMKISRERAARADVILLLGNDAARVIDLGVVWNEREDQIVRVIDDAELRDSRLEAWEEAYEFFESEPQETAPQRLVA